MFHVNSTAADFPVRVIKVVWRWSHFEEPADRNYNAQQHAEVCSLRRIFSHNNITSHQTVLMISHRWLTGRIVVITNNWMDSTLEVKETLHTSGYCSCLYDMAATAGACVLLTLRGTLRLHCITTWGCRSHPTTWVCCKSGYTTAVSWMGTRLCCWCPPTCTGHPLPLPHLLCPSLSPHIFIDPCTQILSNWT